MPKEITQNLLAQFDKEYAKDPVAKVARRALYGTDIADAAKVQEENAQLKNRFSIDIKTLPATNQMQSGRCWIFSGLNTLREPVAKELKLENFEFSQNYTAFYDKLEKANFFMEAVIELKDRPWDDRTLNWVLRFPVGDGGQWDMLTAVIEKYGLVPKDVMPETYASSHTRSLGSLMNTRLRKFAVDVRKAADKKEVNKLKETCLKEIYSMLCTCFGVPPQSFDFEYVDKDKKYHCDKGLTPKSFYEKYVHADFSSLASLINSPREETPFNEMFTVKFLGNVVGVPVSYLNVTIEEMKKAVIAQLKDGKVVWFGSDCGKFGDRKAGTWAPENYDYESLFGVNFEISKEDSLYACQSAMNHAMVITGVNLDGKKATKWKIENSWGEDVANKGYFVASDEWFDRYVYQAVVEKKYLPKKIAAAMTKKKIELEPWDPMGTLAD
ncbi:MAG: C1 family peptidase [Erysipelotrichaceae bacterium]|nr:C1 family peptidase [Erysipelotrichaceae bacterium]